MVARNFAQGEWDCLPCPTRDIGIAESDRGTLWIVRYNDGEHKGEIGIFLGRYAETHARLFRDAPDMAAELERLRARVAELERDAARLDAIERARLHVKPGAAGGWHVGTADWAERSPSLRAAIDAATGDV